MRAVLIATQLTDIVEHSTGASANTDRGAGQSAQNAARSKAAGVTAAVSSAGIKESNTAMDACDLHFYVIDAAGVPMIDLPYRIEIAGGEPVVGRTDSEASTNKVASTVAARATLHVYEPEVTPINPNWDR